MEFDNPPSGHENDLTPLERRLAAWRPALGTLDHDRMLFDAGKAAAWAADRGRFWRLATAASVVATVTLGGLLAHERSQRLALESMTTARNDRQEQDPRPSTPTSAPLPSIEVPGPSSYLALASRLAQGDRDLSMLDLEVESRPRRPAPASSKSSPSLGPLRPADLERVFDL
jgi:hypothetical protein